MTRPQIIRADTIDLQDQHSPSAQDHSRQPTHPAPLGIGAAAPHQAAAVRHVAQERSSEEHQAAETWNETTILRQDPPSDDDDDDNDNIHDGHDDVAKDERNLQRDELAVRQNGGMSGSDDPDMADAEVDDGLEDDNMDRISSSPSIDDEDIDFDFVYALHTFQAVVDGQANATKGDTMVLLDDSNSYWWLVRIVKDGTIGYLPAEHIETPTERLARLNKHRNIDLSATMLGDNTEKSKNPLKKAMRRRNAKTVTFTAPTYVEASDYDYSSEESEKEDNVRLAAEPRAEQEQEKEDSEQKEDGMAVEPLNIGSGKKEKKEARREKDLKQDSKKVSKQELRRDGKSKNSSDEDKAEELRDASDEVQKNGTPTSGQLRTSDEIFDQPLNQKVSKNGTLRNTDSFFKDDNAETRKITLTPALFRDDGATGPSRPSDSKERSSSFDITDRNDKGKDDKKRKDKKPGMLSGLFKRKEKKKGVSEGFEADEKSSEEISRGSPQPKISDDVSTEKIDSDGPQRQPSKGKLHKMQPRTGEVSPPKKRQQESSDSESPEPSVQQTAVGPMRGILHGGSTMRVVSPTPEPERPVALRMKSPERQGERSKQTPDEQSQDRLEDHETVFSENHTSHSVAPNRSTKGLDGSMMQLGDDPNNLESQQRTIDRLSESPVQVSPVDELDASKPPGLVGDSSSHEEHSVSPASTSPSLIDLPIDLPSSFPNGAAQSQGQPSPAGPPPSRPAPTLSDGQSFHQKARSTPSPAPVWSDAHLRAYFEESSDIKDLLLVINDTSGVVPATKDHPIMSGLFAEERTRLTSMSKELDGLLVTFLDKKRRNTPA